LPPTNQGGIAVEWEYHVEDVQDMREAVVAGSEREVQNILRHQTIESRLGTLGGAGWELTSAAYMTESRSPYWKMIFKRPKG
jgi:hypothetical protein